MSEEKIQLCEHLVDQLYSNQPRYEWRFCPTCGIKRAEPKDPLKEKFEQVFQENIRQYGSSKEWREAIINDLVRTVREEK